MVRNYRTITSLTAVNITIASKILLVVLCTLSYFASGSKPLRELEWYDTKTTSEKVDGLDNYKLQDEVNAWLGTPYKAGGMSRKGTDCSGFVMSVYKKVYGITLAHSSFEMSKNTSKIKRVKRLKEGDLVFFRTTRRRVSHVGIYLKGNLFIHASTQNGVEITSLEETYYKKRFVRGGRVKQND
jgi:hypothetical protein